MYERLEFLLHGLFQEFGRRLSLIPLPSFVMLEEREEAWRCFTTGVYENRMRLDDRLSLLVRIVWLDTVVRELVGRPSILVSQQELTKLLRSIDQAYDLYHAIPPPKPSITEFL